MKRTGLQYSPTERAREESAMTVFGSSAESSRSFVLRSTDGLCLELARVNDSHGQVKLIVLSVESGGGAGFASLKGAMLSFAPEARIASGMPFVCRADRADGVTSVLRLPGVAHVGYI